MRPPRLLLVSEPGEYGVMTYVSSLVNHLHQHHPDTRLDLAFSSRRPSDGLWKMVEAVENHGGETVDLKVGHSPEYGDVKAAQILWQLQKKNNYSLVHAHSSKAGALVRLLALLTPKWPRTLYSPHGYFGMARRGGLREWTFNTVEKFLGRVGHTHVVSSYERDFASNRLHIPSTKISLIYHGIDTTHFHPVSFEEKRRLRQQLGLPIDGKILATVGREAYEKNYQDLYAGLNEALPSADWYFAHAGKGSTTLRSALCPAAKARALAFEFLQRPFELLQAGDGFVLTSRTEAFGLAAYEALCCGLPLILTASTGLLQLKEFPFSNIHWLPDPGSEASIHSQLLQALQDWSSPEKHSEDQHALARELFQQTTQLEKIWELYGKLDEKSQITMP